MKRTKTKMCRMWFTSLLIMLYATSGAQVVTPNYYFTFDGTNPLKDSLTTNTLNTTSYNSLYTIDGATSGSIGKSLKLDATGRIILAPRLTLDSLLVVEFLFKPSLNFNTTQFINRKDNAFMIKMGYPFIQFNTNTLSPTGATINDNLKVDLEGIGRKTYGYYTDGNWHHLVFKYNTKSGSKEIWVDGQNPEGFSVITATGLFNPNTATPSNNDVCINTTTSYYKFFGNIDEIAFYSKSLPASSIYQHYMDMQQQKHYNFNSTLVFVPVAAAVTGSVDINDFAPGHPSYTVNAVDQLKAFPLPRYKKNHTLSPNFNWLGLRYLSGEFQPGVSMATAVNNSVEIQKQLAKNFNYYLLVSCNTSTSTQYTDLTKFHGAWVKLANDNPQWKSSAISFWAQLSPQAFGYSSNTGYIENKNLPNNHYLRNSSGQFLSLTGTVSANKFWSPASPMDSFIYDGLTQQIQVRRLTTALTRPLDFICENGEVIPKPGTIAMSADPNVVLDKTLTAITDWDTYLGMRKTNLSNFYRDQFMTMPQLANTSYAEYQVCGQSAHHKYSETRMINETPTGKHLSTPDFYPRWPNNWLTGTSAWNGWQDIIGGRYSEIQLGDNLYSPFVSAGWNEDEERNIRPGQWLGLLKCMGMLGAEYYFAGFFNEAASYNLPNPPPAKPEGYVWQAVIPAYAQAVTSRYEDLLRNGELMTGDVPNSYTNPTAPGYSFEAGDPRKLVVIRKSKTQNIYAITGTIQPNSNMAGNTEIESEATITLDGQKLKFKIRRQGSTYIYDNSNPSQPVFYQLDEWHESSHPYRWSKDFTLESELADVLPASVTIKTEKAVNATSGDYRNASSFISFSNSANAVQYSFEPRATGNYYLWVRARSINGNTTGLSVAIDSANARTIGCINDTTWRWYSIDGCSQLPITYNNLSAAEHTLKINVTTNDILLDKIFLTADGSLNLNPNQAACSATAATISTSGPTGFCPGGTVSLTASNGLSYIWSSGQTTKTISVSASGSYSVTVNNNGCNSLSAPVNVTQFTTPTATVTNLGPVTICQGDSVSLQSSNASAYIWSNGKTTASISANASGAYSVTITDANGCTGTSSALNVTVSSLPTASINPSGVITIVPGQILNLSAGGGNTYTWIPGNTTSGNLDVSAAGDYKVIATSVNGCSDTSDAVTINLAVVINAQISVDGNNYICPGASKTLTASQAASYLWAPNGETTQSIQVMSAGNYKLTAYDGYGNNGSTTVTIIDAAEPAAPSVAINYIPNAAYQLTASEPSASSYLWSTGQTSSTINVTSPNIYTAVAINAFGCTSDPAIMDVNSITGQPCGRADMLTTYNITDIEATIAWNPAVTGDAFTIYMWKTGTTAVQNYSAAGNVSSFRLTGMQGSTDYSWKVQTQCAGLLQMSDVGTFRTNASILPCGSIPQNPTASNINTNTATLNWFPTVATSFKVRYRVIGAASYHFKTYNGTLNQAGGPITGLVAGTMYEWSILAFCNGVSTAYSPSSYFSTINTCGYLGNTSAINVSPTTATIGWQSVISMDTIRIRVKNMSNNTDRNIYILGTPNTGQYLIKNLRPNTTYQIDVRGKCSTGALGAWSPKVTVTTTSVAARAGDDNPLGIAGYPNPTRDYLNYIFETDTPEDYILKVCDMSGRELFQEVRTAENGSNAGDISVTKYSPGLYLMIIQKGALSSRFTFAVN
ncbi:MAG: fibronectin type III domain-containing protein [Bacteroidota bacterium]